MKRPAARPAAHVLALTLTLHLAACSSNDSDPPEGGECQLCRDSTPQCDSGMTCRRFQSDAAFYSLCAKPTMTSCPVPFAGGLERRPATGR